MDKFWELLKESVIVQGILTLALTGAVIYLTCTGQEIPGLLADAFLLVMGFYFGSKFQQAISASK